MAIQARLLPGLQASPSALTPTDVASFLGRPEDPSTPDEVTAHLETVTAMVRADTRGRGLSTAGEPADDLAGVILTSTVRMLANPEQVEYNVGVILHDRVGAVQRVDTGSRDDYGNRVFEDDVTPWPAGYVRCLAPRLSPAAPRSRPAIACSCRRARPTC